MIHKIFTILVAASSQGKHILHVLQVVWRIENGIAHKNPLLNAAIYNVFWYLGVSEMNDSITQTLNSNNVLS